jgi:hypothetical protein
VLDWKDRRPWLTVPGSLAILSMKARRRAAQNDRSDNRATPSGGGEELARMGSWDGGWPCPKGLAEPSRMASGSSRSSSELLPFPTKAGMGWLIGGQSQRPRILTDARPPIGSQRSGSWTSNYQAEARRSSQREWLLEEVLQELGLRRHPPPAADPQQGVEDRQIWSA